jgi:hypothetical protein
MEAEITSHVAAKIGRFFPTDKVTAAAFPFSADAVEKVFSG